MFLSVLSVQINYEHPDCSVLQFAIVYHTAASYSFLIHLALRMCNLSGWQHR